MTDHDRPEEMGDLIRELARKDIKRLLKACQERPLQGPSIAPTDNLERGGIYAIEIEGTVTHTDYSEHLPTTAQELHELLLSPDGLSDLQRTQAVFRETVKRLGSPEAALAATRVVCVLPEPRHGPERLLSDLIYIAAVSLLNSREIGENIACLMTAPGETYGPDIVAEPEPAPKPKVKLPQRRRRAPRKRGTSVRQEKTVELRYADGRVEIYASIKGTQRATGFSRNTLKRWLAGSHRPRPESGVTYVRIGETERAFD